MAGFGKLISRRRVSYSEPIKSRPERQGREWLPEPRGSGYIERPPNEFCGAM